MASRGKGIVVAGVGLLAALAVAAPAHAVSDGLVPTPPMGWNGWYDKGCDMTEQTARATADALVRTGMRDAGYRYLNLDDCWMAGQRDAAGNLRADRKKFPSGIAALARYAHGRGLKLGIYISGGPKTCEGRPGSIDTMDRDMALFAQWGIDLVKVDWCEAAKRHANAPLVMSQARAAIAKTGRQMLLSICEWGYSKPWAWAGPVGHIWRTTQDIPWYDGRNRWRATLKVAMLTEEVAEAAGPGGWNDPDILQVGLGGLDRDENRAVMALWAMLAAPLFAGADIRTMNASIGSILVNRDVIAVDQDPLGRSGERVLGRKWVDLWVRPLAGGDRAVLVLNRLIRPTRFVVNPAAIFGVQTGSWRVRDLWEHRTRTATKPFTITVPGHAAAFFRMSPP